LLYAFCAALNSCNLGYDIGVSTNAGPKLQQYFNLTDRQLEVFLGSINFCSIFGALLSPVVSDRWGRRWTFNVAAVGFLVGVAVMASSRTYSQLLAGRTIVGLGVGTGEAIDPMYISEIAPAEHRGYLVSWAEAGVAVGVVTGFASSLFLFPFLDDDPNEWRYMLGLGAVMPLVMLFLVARVMPESPRWLLTKGHEQQARTVLERTYPPGHDVDAVVTDIRSSLELEWAAQTSVGWGAIFFPSPAVRRMLLVGVGIAIIQQAVGIDSIMFYLLFVVRQSGVSSEMGQIAALIALGTVKLGFVFVGARLIDTVGRRPLLFASLMGECFQDYSISTMKTDDAHF